MGVIDNIEFRVLRLPLAARLTTVIVSSLNNLNIKLDLNFNFFIDTRAFFKIKILIVNTIFITRKRMNIEIK